jgi:uncharacterized protein (DUF362 family)
VAGGAGGYENTVRALANVNLSCVRKKKVLLKPNAGRIAAPGSGVCTGPEVMAAAMDVFADAGAIVHVGESPITGVKTPEAFDITGIAAEAHRRNIPLIDMDARPFVPVSIPDGVAINTLKLCPEMFEYDIVVSIPVMKTHMHTGVTLGVKNMKGCLWRRSKVVLHMLAPVEGFAEKPLDIAIADMSGILRPHLTIIDGTVGMEGIGPSAGTPKRLDAVVVGVDAFAADAVACALMGKDARKVAHLRIGASRGYGVIDLARIDATPGFEQWASAFADPPTDIAIGVPDFTILDQNSCSACQSSLLLFLRLYADRIREILPADSKPVFAIGKGHDTVPPGTFCIGNCTRRNRDQGRFIQGCPPVGSEILRFITGSPYADGHSGKDD